MVFLADVVLLAALHHLNQFTELLLTRRFHGVVPGTRVSYRNLVIASDQPFVGLLGEVIERHADAPSILDVRLVLLVVELS